MLVFSGEIRVAVDRLNPPHVVQQDGVLQGETIDLLKRVFGSQGVDVTFVQADGPVAQSVQLSAGRADVAADLSITDRRMRWYRFSRHYAVEELQIFTLAHGPLWPGLAHFHGVLGVKADSYAQEHFIRHHRGMPLFVAQTADELVDALRRGRVQAIVLARRTGAALSQDWGFTDILARGDPFGPTLLALAALPEHAEALETFNAGLALHLGSV